MYPTTRVTDDVDELAGVTFPDPYRWLEGDGDDVRRWQDAQGEVAASYVRDWPHFDRLRESVARFTVPRIGFSPRTAGGRWFRAAVAEGASQARVIVADEPFGEGRVLFDPAAENPDRPPYVSWISPSPDGSMLAVGVCDDGSERNTIRLIDTETGARLREPPRPPLKDNWTAGAHWLPDSTGFFFTGTDDSPTSVAHDVWLHRRVPEPTTTLVDGVSWLPEQDYRTVVVSRDGAYAVALQRLLNPVPVAVARLDDPAGLQWRPFVTGVDGTLAGHLVGEEWIAVTDVGAPRGRVVAIALDAKDPDDPASWREIVPESDTVIRTLTPVGDLLYLSELSDTYAKVRVVDGAGAACGQVPLPGRGALAEQPFPLMNLMNGHAEAYLFEFSTLVGSWGTYRHRPGEPELEVLREPEVVIENAVVEDGWATSEDGTRIPYHVVRLRDISLNRPRPALMYAYGGFNVSWTPQFPGPIAAFVAAGGVYVHCHLRGGAEFGRAWWEGGRLANKQNGYADLYAIAHDLIATGVTSSNLLAVTGGSNGGLMSGVALTQRPRLWAAVVPRVPLLDLVGACRDVYGRYVVELEFADPADPGEVERMAEFSPYHLVKDGVEYPAVFIDAGDTDPRCPPWHARKFGARLQAATAGEAPILVRVWSDVGHGWATDREVAITQNTEWLAFTMKTLGLAPR
ncbi:prolyl oligopeptidase family serine peptidase [Streptosporangium amethystogenes]|uniref:prolyl oligopeptidase family serine peptidase n=1 Tax=Streptosporangium amethystogenes TaxID=2002 RepID=UPI0004C49A84|nr:prolyl oligopeptidase family serine peptidase [Streptosporangium amethystogenes]